MTTLDLTPGDQKLRLRRGSRWAWYETHTLEDPDTGEDTGDPVDLSNVTTVTAQLRDARNDSLPVVLTLTATVDDDPTTGIVHFSATKTQTARVPVGTYAWEYQLDTASTSDPLDGFAPLWGEVEVVNRLAKAE